MAKLVATACLSLLCVLALAQAKPKPVTHPKLPLEQRLQATELKFAQMAAKSGKTTEQLAKIEAQLDALLKTLQAFHQRVAPKPPGS